MIRTKLIINSVFLLMFFSGILLEKSIAQENNSRSTKNNPNTIVEEGGFYSMGDDFDFELSKNLDIYHTLFRELNLHYVDELDPGKMIRVSMEKMLQQLDPYTIYIPESRIEDYRASTTGQYAGIGALVNTRDTTVVIVDPYKNYPAHRAGLKAGDEVISIDGKIVGGLKSEDISHLLKGQPGTELEIVIRRKGEPNNLTKTVIREQIKIKNVPYFGMLNKEIGYIILSGFTNDASGEVRRAMSELVENQDAKSIVLDLRGNPGGLLIEAVHIVNLFVPRGQEIVSTRGKVEMSNIIFKTRNEAVDVDIPLAVIVNSGSASAAEIVSGAIQDLDRGVVIGQRTFGKGLVQKPLPLSYNAQVKLTTAKYYIPSGRCIQALDYSNRNLDGSVGKVPDSLITEFYTQSGRSVFDGGGVLPDIQTEVQIRGQVVSSLIAKYLIFDFVTEYTLDMDSITNPDDFVETKEMFTAFMKYIETKEFKYVTKREGALNELIETAKREKYYEEASDEFEALKVKLAHNQEGDLKKFEEEITHIIAGEILARFMLQSGRHIYSLRHDIEVKKAIEVLSDKALYTKTLAK